MDLSTGFVRGSSGAESRNTGQGGPGAHYSGGLFDLLMGEHYVSTKDVFESEADVLGSDDLHAGPPMSDPESKEFQASQAVHSNNPQTQPFPGGSDRSFEPEFSNVQASRGRSRHTVTCLTNSMKTLSSDNFRNKVLTPGAGFSMHLPPINQAIPTHFNHSGRQHRR
jgi:hypothetical protein